MNVTIININFYRVNNMEKKAESFGSKLSSMLGWGIGCLLILIGVFAFFAALSEKNANVGNIFMGFSFLLSGLILVPPALTKLRIYFPFLNRKYWPPLASLLIFIFTSIFAGTFLPKHQTNSKQKPSDNIVEKPNDAPLPDKQNTEALDTKARLKYDIKGDAEIPVSEKELVEKGALKVLADDKNCSQIDFVSKSSNTKGKYYVTCNTPDGMPYNVWFSPSDVKSGKTLASPEPIQEEIARETCISEIKSRATHPSTLKIHTVTGYASNVFPNGRRQVIQSFEAQNSFGLKTQNTARCLFMEGGKYEITIVENQN